MTDTISAAAGIQGEARLTFVTPQELPGIIAVGASHITGSAFAGEASTGLVVNFATLTPDASGWCDVAAASDPSPSVAAGYATGSTDLAGPVIVGALAGSDQSGAG